MAKAPKEKRQEKQHEAAVAAFFEQAIKDGRMTREELRELGDNGERNRQKTLKVFEDFIVDSCCHRRGRPRVTEAQKDRMRRLIDARLTAARITQRHVELFINYPEWTERELSRAFDIPQQTINQMLARVRSVWPGLRHDTAIRDEDECPALRNMDRIEFSDSDRLDEDRIRQKF